MKSKGDARPELLGMPREQMGRFFEQLGEKPFRARQVMKWLHGHGVCDFEAMTDLGKTLRGRLADQVVMAVPEVLSEQRSTDGTRKWALRLDDQNAIETVYIPDPGRGTLCVSSQVGCALDCTFCATARQGFNRNLSAAEIVAQLWFARHALAAEPEGGAQITNVVLMGMGEPLLNFDNVVDAMRIMLDDFGYGLSKRRVTLSTSGVVPLMDRLRDTVDVSLAVSLHAPVDTIRDRLVPLNRRYPIKALMAACQRYIDGKTRKQSITFEYVMLDGINDTPEHARRLAGLLGALPSKVNLIPFNPFPGSHYRCSPQDAIDRFRDVLQGRGLTTITRRPRGQDIDAACGQLVGRVEDRARRSARFQKIEAQLELSGGA